MAAAAPWLAVPAAGTRRATAQASVCECLKQVCLCPGPHSADETLSSWSVVVYLRRRRRLEAQGLYTQRADPEASREWSYQTAGGSQTQKRDMR